MTHPLRRTTLLLLLTAAYTLTACSPTFADEAAVVSRILFGSCIKQEQPMPILETIVDERPELFIFLGDNIYADTTHMLHPRGTPTKNPLRAVPSTFHRDNYGVIDIDWTSADPSISLEIRDVDKTVRLKKVLHLGQLQAAPQQ